MSLPDSSEQPIRSQQVRAAESTRRLLDAAIELIAEKGFERTTAIEIGERAGYSRSMVRFRYGSKEALLESLLRNEYEPLLLATPPEGLNGHGRALNALSRICIAAQTQPALLRAFFTICFETVGPIEQLKPWLSDWLSRFETEVASSLREGIADGSVAAHVDPDLEGRRSIAMGLGVGFRWALDPSRDFVAEWTDYIDRAAAEWRNP
ncbi:TetR/AcrR family transcriptional regulator [Mycobacterium sp.]|jgi:AcrR family transcriptional regulator|uniref:TetR/AcrR family transcriptional regulator n=1 Tax=Mycobacterium sp. TaxID=1785 RepID=UPI002CA5E689|nr:TetR/AcrR family transcriptional regulator [Mycobacterium sp.]HXB85905.1 TetR/AcrR family transcriptional regulator [Mycobacterium sp.]